MSFLLSTDTYVVGRECDTQSMLARLVGKKLPHVDVDFLFVESVESVNTLRASSYFHEIACA